MDFWVLQLELWGSGSVVVLPWHCCGELLVEVSLFLFVPVGPESIKLRTEVQHFLLRAREHAREINESEASGVVRENRL